MHFFFFILRSIKMKFDFMQIFNAQSQKTEWMKKFFNNPMIYFSLNVSSRESDRRGGKKLFVYASLELFYLKYFMFFYSRLLLFHVADFLKQWIFSRVFFGLLFPLRYDFFCFLLLMTFFWINETLLYAPAILLWFCIFVTFLQHYNALMEVC